MICTLIALGLLLKTNIKCMCDNLIDDPIKIYSLYASHPGSENDLPNAGGLGLNSVLEDPWEEGMATTSSRSLPGSPWTEKPLVGKESNMTETTKHST